MRERGSECRAEKRDKDTEWEKNMKQKKRRTLRGRKGNSADVQVVEERKAPLLGGTVIVSDGYAFQKCINKAGYTANTSRGRVGRGGNACFPLFDSSMMDQPTNRPTDERTDKALIESLVRD